jgi:hypothetical protein
MIRPGRDEHEVRMQGRSYELNQFEPSLGLVNLVEAPWSPGEKMLVAGGWETFAVPALIELLTDGDSTGGLSGVICAKDTSGRWATYDPRRFPRESLAECLLRNIPQGLTVEETFFEQFRLKAKARSWGQVDFAISVWMGVFLLLLAGGRIWLLWERTRIQTQLSRARNDRVLGSASPGQAVVRRE